MYDWIGSGTGPGLGSDPPAGDSDPLITQVIRHYYPEWDPPKDRGTEWQKALCPFHGESNPSASISFRNDAFRCHACGAGGSAISIIMREEEMTYRQAIEYAESIFAGSDIPVSRKPARKPGRRTFGGQGSDGERANENRDSEVPARVRRRSAPWT